MEWTFYLVEIIAVLSATAIFLEAKKQNSYQLFIMLIAICFGLAAEIYFVHFFSGYSYGNFLLEIPVGSNEVIPLWVGLGWGVIIWTAMRSGDRFNLPWYLQPALDALLALSIDITLDPIAQELGWWHWTRAGGFFGIPYDNFIGWLLIVGSYSFSTRAFYKILKNKNLSPILAIIPSLLMVMGSQFVLEKIYPVIGEPLTFFILLSILFALVLPSIIKNKISEKVAWFSKWIPITYHGLMIFLLMSTNIFVDEPALIIVMLSAALASILSFQYKNP
jgi:uncharacterized membrane protein